MWLTPHPHAISIDKKMSNLVTVNYNKLVTMEGVSNNNVKELVEMIIDIPDGVMLEVELGEEDADDRREGV